MITGGVSSVAMAFVHAPFNPPLPPPCLLQGAELLQISFRNDWVETSRNDALHFVPRSVFSYPVCWGVNLFSVVVPIISALQHLLCSMHYVSVLEIYLNIAFISLSSANSAGNSQLCTFPTDERLCHGEAEHCMLIGGGWRVNTLGEAWIVFKVKRVLTSKV